MDLTFGPIIVWTTSSLPAVAGALCAVKFRKPFTEGVKRLFRQNYEKTAGIRSKIKKKSLLAIFKNLLDTTFIRRNVYFKYTVTTFHYDEVVTIEDEEWFQNDVDEEDTIEDDEQFQNDVDEVDTFEDDERFQNDVDQASAVISYDGLEEAVPIQIEDNVFGINEVQNENGDAELVQEGDNANERNRVPNEDGEAELVQDGDNVEVGRERNEAEQRQIVDGVAVEGNEADQRRNADNVLRQVVQLCHVNEFQKFSSALSYWKQESVLKISEGSYSEIYQFRDNNDCTRVFKCIAIGGKHLEKHSPNLSVNMAIPDIICSRMLSKLDEGPLYIAPNFPKVHSICFVKDKFPDAMLRAWWEYKNHPNRHDDPSDHPQPNLYAPDQTFLTIESTFCGQPLVQNALRNAWLGVGVITQLVSALAVAEEAFGFEHRDLHLGNVLLKQAQTSTLKYSIGDLHFSVQTIGQQVFIIDFTLSRMHLHGKAYSVDLDSIEGEEEAPDDDDEQSESFWLHHTNMYGRMSSSCDGNWDAHVPYTNIIWLKHISESILSCLQKSNTGLLRLLAGPGDCAQMRAIRILREWNDCILDHQSANRFLRDVILGHKNPLVAVHQ